jgi:hypothetical protein
VATRAFTVANRSLSRSNDDARIDFTLPSEDAAARRRCELT